MDYFDNAYPSKYDYCERLYPFPERVQGVYISEKSRYRYSDPNPYNSLSLQYTYRGLNIGDGKDIVSCQVATYPD
ncbi:MAG: hypothetical protein Q4B28_08735 [bacterium]|nr:hypothetical protein [bacterium]